MEKEFEFIEVVNALEKAELAPLIIPCLKIIDPIAGQIPEGAIKGYLTQIRPREGRFDFIEKLAPRLPGIIKWAGRIAKIKPLMIVFNLTAELLALILKILMPGLALCIRFPARIIGAVKGRFAGQTR